MDSENFVNELVVPEGKNLFAVLDETGDTRTMWDPNNEVEVEEARAQFDRLKAKGYSAFHVDEKDPNKTAKRMKDFDPKASRVIFSPPLQGG